MLDFTKEGRTETSGEMNVHPNSNLSWPVFQFFIIVCKTSINEDNVTMKL